jgi:hypothetical protein
MLRPDALQHTEASQGAGGVDVNRPLRSAVAVVTVIALIVAGCSRAVRVPDNKLAPSTEWKGLYRVTTTTDQFTARHFSVTDSTLVITELGGTDKHYALVKLPVRIPLSDVKSVERLEGHDSQRAITIAGIVVVSLLIVAIIVLGNNPVSIY